MKFQVRLPKANNFKGYQDYTKTKTTTVVPRCELTTPTTEQVSNGECGQDCNVDETTYTFSRHVIRSNYMGKSIEAKKKVRSFKSCYERLFLYRHDLLICKLCFNIVYFLISKRNFSGESSQF